MLEIKNLDIAFATEDGVQKAVHGISFSISKNEVVAVVGESGSGKSITSLSVLGLLPSPPASYPNGEILFQQKNGDVLDLLKATPQQIQTIRGNEIAMIFQEPMTSLNPVFTCGDQVMEAIQLHQKISKAAAQQKTIELFEKVKLPNPSTLINRYPHELSGGQKQRVMIAMAMSCNPSLLIADEPTTALDVTVQKTILQLMKELQQENGMGILFITHDLGVVQELADKIVVLYKGSIVEQGTVNEIFNNPQHPYTKALLACRPSLYTKEMRLPVVSDFLEVENGKWKMENEDAADSSKPIVSSEADINDKEQTTNHKLLSVQHLNVWFPAQKKLFGKTTNYIKAVNDVSFDIYKGETLGLVGESGCGKTTLGRTLLRLIEPTSGKIILNHQNILDTPLSHFKQYRKDLQIVFQDPYSSLNPRLSIGSAIAEPMLVHRVAGQQKRQNKK